MIKGSTLRDSIISASNSISINRRLVDELNVFPVPDGDTGTNMSMTIGASVRELSRLDDQCAAETVSDIAASALLRGARGNSGVILSLLFRGMAKGLRGQDQIDGNHLSKALSLGVESAYKAVMKPTEGTMLTVARVAAESAQEFCKENDDPDPVAVWERICATAALALEKTPEQLPVLKKAGVVDAGGKGLLFIFNGMLSVFKDGIIIQSDSSVDLPTQTYSKAVGKVSHDIKFAYCTEFIIDLDKKKTNNPLNLRAYLESIGDSLVFVDDESIIKVHVHTNEPGNAIQKALDYGQLMNMKIDNMRIQHENSGWVDDDSDYTHEGDIVADPEKPIGFVAVAAGDGLQTVFKDLGVDVIVKGGQTMNPSTEDILDAVNATPAEHVFVLPNNKNIIMAAEQVIPLADKKVSVLHTKTIPQGLTAILNFDPDESDENNHLQMMKSASRVGTGLVTFAARNSAYDGHNIKEGDIMGLANNKIVSIESDPCLVAYRVTKQLFKKGVSSFVTLIYGEGIAEEEANQVAKRLTDKYDGDIDVTVVNGGQPVYYFIISVE